MEGLIFGILRYVLNSLTIISLNEKTVEWRGGVVSALDSQSGNSGFEFRSGHLLDLFLVLPSSSLRPRLSKVNWLPTTSCYVLFGLFVPNYLSEYP